MNKDFQNGFALGIVSGGVIIEDTLPQELINEISNLLGGPNDGIGEVIETIFEESANFTYDDGTRMTMLTTFEPDTVETPYSYTLSIGDNEYEVIAVHIDGLLIMTDNDSVELIETEEGIMLMYTSEDTEEKAENVKITKTDQSFCHYAFAVSNSRDTTNAVLYSYEFVEGDATLLVVDEKGTQLVNENLILTIKDATDELLYGFESEYSTDHYFSTVALYEALSEGKACTITVTQIVDDKEKVTTFGGVNDMPKFQEAEGTDNYWFNHYDCYYWGNTFIPFAN